MSDLAEHLGLRGKDELFTLISAAGLVVAGKMDIVRVMAKPPITPIRCTAPARRKSRRCALASSPVSRLHSIFWLTAPLAALRALVGRLSLFVFVVCCLC
jgi:hypothetical protein